MKRIILISVLLCILCAGTVSAYGVYLNCTDSVQAGQSLKCTIDSDLPAGTSFDLVFYESIYTATELDRLKVTVQKDKDTQYKLFDTRGYKGGQYKVEIQFPDGGYLGDLRSDSMTSRLVKIIDRSDEITITAPTTQMLADALQIDGSIAKKGSDGVQLEVKGQNTGKVFGSQYIPTTKDIKSGDGKFTWKVTVTHPDVYDVYFSDPELIGIVSFEVISPTPTLTSVPATTTTFRTTRTTQTTPPTPIPTPTKSPLAEIVVLGALGITGFVFSRVSKKP